MIRLQDQTRSVTLCRSLDMELDPKVPLDINKPYVLLYIPGDPKGLMESIRRAARKKILTSKPRYKSKQTFLGNQTTQDKIMQESRKLYSLLCPFEHREIVMSGVKGRYFDFTTEPTYGPGTRSMSWMPDTFLKGSKKSRWEAFCECRTSGNGCSSFLGDYMGMWYVYVNPSAAVDSNTEPLKRLLSCDDQALTEYCVACRLVDTNGTIYIKPGVDIKGVVKEHGNLSDNIDLCAGKVQIGGSLISPEEEEERVSFANDLGLFSTVVQVNDGFAKTKELHGSAALFSSGI